MGRRLGRRKGGWSDGVDRADPSAAPTYEDLMGTPKGTMMMIHKAPPKPN